MSTLEETLSSLGMHFSGSGDALGTPATATYSPLLVVFSYAVAVMASYGAIRASMVLTHHTSPRARTTWLLIGALTFGIGTWAMHFLGMLAVNLTFPVGYDIPITVFSAIPAILAAAVALHLATRERLSTAKLATGGLLMGLGIGCMHYTGMHGMQMNAAMYYDVGIFLASLIIAVLLATLALYLLHRTNNSSNLMKLLGATVMGGAIAGMHYLGMASVTFFPADLGHDVTAIDSSYLVLSIGLIVCIILALTIVASVIDLLVTRTQQENERLEEQVVRRTSQLEHEIGERLRYEEQLRRKELEGRAALENMPGGIAFVDPDFNIIVTNNNYWQLYDIPQELIQPGQPIVNMFRFLAERGDYGVGTVEDLVAERIDSLKRPGFQTLENYMPDGRIIEVRRSRMEDGSVVTVTTDITERKHAEEELKNTLRNLRKTQESLVQAEKMASLGSLVAGVAHEINTPIGIGVTAASHLKESADQLSSAFASNQMKKSDLETFIDSTLKSTGILASNLDRAADLIKSFKQVAVDQTSEAKRNFHLGPYLEEVLMSLHPKLKMTKISVAIQCDPEIVLNSYPGAVSQIITNLVINSLTHGYDEGQTGTLRIDVTSQDGLVLLAYADDGRGMTHDVASKVFEPFFTTRRGQGGSGLGMHIIHNIVTQSLNGTISCTSAIGEGTTFTIRFPADSPDLNRVPAAPDNDDRPVPAAQATN